MLRQPEAYSRESEPPKPVSERSKRLPPGNRVNLRLSSFRRKPESSDRGQHRAFRSPCMHSAEYKKTGMIRLHYRLGRCHRSFWIPAFAGMTVTGSPLPPAKRPPLPPGESWGEGKKLHLCTFLLFILLLFLPNLFCLHSYSQPLQFYEQLQVQRIEGRVAGLMY